MFDSVVVTVTSMWILFRQLEHWRTFVNYAHELWCCMYCHFLVQTSVDCLWILFWLSHV